MEQSGDYGRGRKGLSRQFSTRGLHPRCQRMLEDAGFTWNPDTGAWVNAKAGRVIAFDKLEQCTPKWLAARLP